MLCSNYNENTSVRRCSARAWRRSISSCDKLYCSSSKRTKRFGGCALMIDSPFSSSEPVTSNAIGGLSSGNMRRE